MSNAIQTEIKKPQTVGELLLSKRKQLEAALPKHMSVNRLLQITMTCISRNPKLKECTAQSLIGAVLQASQLGLEPDPILGHSYLVPYKNKKKGCTEAQFMAGYKGYIELATRSGRVSRISAHAVFDKDKFEYAFGLARKLEHKPAFGRDRGNLIYAYAVVQMKDGVIDFDVMDRAEIDAIRARSRSKDDGPWVTDFAEMAKKTVIRRICKTLPMSPEVQKAAALDEMGDLEIAQDNDAVLAGLIEDPTGLPMEANQPARIQATLPGVTSASSESQQPEPGSFHEFEDKP